MVLFALIALGAHLIVFVLALLAVLGYALVIRRSGALEPWVLPGLGMGLVAAGGQLMLLGGEGIRMMAGQSGLAGHALVLLPAVGIVLLLAPLVLSLNLASRGYGAAALLAALPLVFYAAYALSNFGLRMLPAMPTVPPLLQTANVAVLVVVGLGVIPVVVLRVWGPLRAAIMGLTGLTLEVAALLLCIAVLANGFGGQQMAQVGLIHGGVAALLLALAGLMWASRRGERLTA
jgi:hypothetical protein